MDYSIIIYGKENPNMYREEDAYNVDSFAMNKIINMQLIVIINEKCFEFTNLNTNFTFVQNNQFNQDIVYVDYNDKNYVNNYNYVDFKNESRESKPLIFLKCNQDKFSPMPFQLNYDRLEEINKIHFICYRNNMHLLDSSYLSNDDLDYIYAHQPFSDCIRVMNTNLNHIGFFIKKDFNQTINAFENNNIVTSPYYQNKWNLPLLKTLWMKK